MNFEYSVTRVIDPFVRYRSVCVFTIGLRVISGLDWQGMYVQLEVSWSGNGLSIVIEYILGSYRGYESGCKVQVRRGLSIRVEIEILFRVYATSFTGLFTGLSILGKRVIAQRGVGVNYQIRGGIARYGFLLLMWLFWCWAGCRRELG